MYGRSEIRLSIAVPSVRPVSEVQRTLESLVRHGWADNPEVEIVLFLNGTADRPVLDTLNENLTVLSTVHRMPIDESMCTAIMSTRGEWVWALGDDDEVSVTPEQLLAELQKCPPSCLFVFLVDRGNQAALVRSEETLQTTFAMFWRQLPFGRIIYRRTALDETSFEVYTGTNHAYSGVIWTTLAARNGWSIATMPSSFLRTRKVSKTYSNSRPQVLFSEGPMWFSRLPQDLGDNLKSTLNVYLLRNVLRHPVLLVRSAHHVTAAPRGWHFPLWYRIVVRAIQAVERHVPSRSRLSSGK